MFDDIDFSPGIIAFKRNSWIKKIFFKSAITMEGLLLMLARIVNHSKIIGSGLFDESR